MKIFWLAILAWGCLSAYGADAARLKALIIDGQNNHNWEATTPVLEKALERSDRFIVEVATAPGSGEDLSGFRPAFSEYDVVISNYNGDLWPEETREALEAYVREGGGFVVVHAANNAFPDWPAYNRMIGLGGWGGRDERSGPYLYYADGERVRDTASGRGGSHGAQHPFPVTVRRPKHPITQGLPAKWMHAEDELYDRLRGPAEDLTILATAYADPDKGGSGREEPMLMTIGFGQGRVFHTTLGHDVKAMQCVGFIATLQRGTEWAATGKVTISVPEDFPTEDEVRSRPY